VFANKSSATAVSHAQFPRRDIDLAIESSPDGGKQVRTQQNVATTIIQNTSPAQVSQTAKLTRPLGNIVV
jgi:hypothetical protein